MRPSAAGPMLAPPAAQESSRVAVVAVGDAADREDVLRPGLRPRLLRAGVALTLGPGDVVVEDDVVGIADTEVYWVVRESPHDAVVWLTSWMLTRSLTTCQREPLTEL